MKRALSALLLALFIAISARAEGVSADATSKIDPEKPLVALTFDDGPNTTTTIQVLDLLKKYQVTASFFLIGRNINGQTAPAVKRAYTMGCEIDNHSWSHGYMDQMTAEEVRAEAGAVSRRVEEITGEPTAFFRPPFIAVSRTMFDNIDMPFICGVGCDDWDPKVTTEQRIQRTLAQVSDGAIILLHDGSGNQQTVEALETIIPALLEQGYQFVTLRQLFELRGHEIRPDDTRIYSVIR